MWVPKSVVEWFHISRETVESLREENSALRAERDALKIQLASATNHFDWLRIRVNTLEVERGQLIEKAYGIRIPVPELARPVTPIAPNVVDKFADLFEDMDDEQAKKLGLPIYGN